MKKLRKLIISSLLVLSIFQLRGYIKELRRIVQWEESIEVIKEEDLESEKLDLSHVEYREELRDLEDRLSSEEISKINKILGNKDIIPDDLLELALDNLETIDFVYNYPEREKYEDIEIRREESINLNRDIPMYLQWDKRWGYKDYGDSIIGLAGCGPTSLSMIISGLRKDVKATPNVIADISMEKGYMTEDNLTSWELISKGGEEFGIISREIPLEEEKMREEILKGHPLIISVSPGELTEIGHILVLSGVNSEGEFIMNDPNSIENSKRSWKFDEIKDDIKNIWSYSLR